MKYNRADRSASVVSPGFKGPSRPFPPSRGLTPAPASQHIPPTTPPKLEKKRRTGPLTQSHGRQAWRGPLLQRGRAAPFVGGRSLLHFGNRALTSGGIMALANSVMDEFQRRELAQTWFGRSMFSSRSRYMKDNLSPSRVEKHGHNLFPRSRHNSGCRRPKRLVQGCHTDTPIDPQSVD